MQPPSHDEKGVLPHDHAEIQNEDRLIRYVRPHVHAHFSDGRWRISSAAFSPSSPPNDPRSSVSVDIERLLLESGMQVPYRCVPPSGVACLGVGMVRGLDLKVGWDPEPDNCCHGGIWGVGNNKSKKAKLAAAAVLLVDPTLE
jgi:hypothetical protein